MLQAGVLATPPAKGRVLASVASGSSTGPAAFAGGDEEPQRYKLALEDAGFRLQSEDIFGTRQVVSAKSGLRQAGKAPIAMLLDCEKPS